LSYRTSNGKFLLRVLNESARLVFFVTEIARTGRALEPVIQRMRTTTLERLVATGTLEAI